MKTALEYGPGIRRLHELARQRQPLVPNCYVGDPERFFPISEKEREDVEAARAACHGCPILLECRRYAINNPDMSGWWGGTTDHERDQIRRRERKQRRAS